MRNDAEILRSIMRRQASLSLKIAAVFVLLLLGLPLANLYLPAITQARFGGFTLTWLILGVLFYPITWLLSATFVRRSDEIEVELVKEIGWYDIDDTKIDPSAVSSETSEEGKP